MSIRVAACLPARAKQRESQTGAADAALRKPTIRIEETRLGLDDIPPELIPLYSHWEKKRGRQDMPARADIDPVELRQVIQYVSLVEFSAPRFVFRIVGANFGRRPGGPRDRRDTSGLQPQPYREMIERQLGEARELRRPTVYAVRLSLAHASLSYRSLCLPLARDGENPNMLLFGADFDVATNDRFWCGYDCAGQEASEE